LINLPFYLKNLILIVCLLGGFIGYFIRKVSLYFFNKSLNYYLFIFINITIWFIPLISTKGIIYYPLRVGFLALKSFDQGWSEYFGGQKIYSLIRYFSILNQKIQNNNLKIYLILFVF
jgi:NADH-ubiquinone oxidoreductase chain 5